MSADGSPASHSGSRPEQILRVPLKIAFTDVAVRYFLTNNKKLGKIRMAENVEEPGLKVEGISLSNLKAMLKLGYISRMEISHPDLLSMRSEIIEITKFLCQSLLFFRFDKELLDYVLKTSAVKQWNRANPTHQINGASTLKLPPMGNEPQKIEQEFRLIKNFILEPLFKQIDHSRNIEKEDKAERKDLCLKYVENVHHNTWSLIAFAYSKNREKEFLLSISEMLDNFIKKSPISEYLSLMLVELIAYIENLNMLQFIAARYEKNITVGQLLKNPALRLRLIGEMEKEEEQTYLIWGVGYNPNTPAAKHKLNVSIFNKGFGYSKVFDEVARKTAGNIEEANLHDFLQGSQSDQFNTELGLNYLSYLKDACKDLGIYFVSSIHKLAKQDLALVNCHLQF
jgi:hypothetical protein